MHSANNVLDAFNMHMHTRFQGPLPQMFVHPFKRLKKQIPTVVQVRPILLRFESSH